ncbi:hypothetical protein KSS87_017813, partial [Heliosperma pusillum]
MAATPVPTPSPEDDIHPSPGSTNFHVSPEVPSAAVDLAVDSAVPLELYAREQDPQNLDSDSTSGSMLFIGSDRAILGEVVVPNTPRSSNQVEVPNTRHSSGRSRGKSIAISSHHSGVTEVALPGASSSTFNPQSKYFKDVIGLSKNVEVALKEVFSTNMLPPTDYDMVFNMLTQSDIRITSFLTYDENAKL